MNNIIHNTENITKIQHYLHMGQWFVSRSLDCELISLGLGSCVALCLYDSTLKVGGMAHIVLPTRNAFSKNKNDRPNARYADEAIPILINAIREHYQNANLCAKLAGGAQMFHGADKGDNTKEKRNINGSGFTPIGFNNSESIKKELAKRKIPIHASDLGGSSGRTVVFNIGTGKMCIKKIGMSESIVI